MIFTPLRLHPLRPTATPRAHGDVPHRHIVPRTGGFDGLLHNGAAGQAAVPGGSGIDGKGSHLDGAAAAGRGRGCRAGGGARWERNRRKRLLPGRGSGRRVQTGQRPRTGLQSRWRRQVGAEMPEKAHTWTGQRPRTGLQSRWRRQVGAEMPETAHTWTGQRPQGADGTQATGHRAQDTGHRTQGAGRRHGRGCRALDTGCRPRTGLRGRRRYQVGAETPEKAPTWTGHRPQTGRMVQTGQRPQATDAAGHRKFTIFAP